MKVLVFWNEQVETSFQEKQEHICLNVWGIHRKVCAQQVPRRGAQLYKPFKEGKERECRQLGFSETEMRWLCSGKDSSGQGQSSLDSSVLPSAFSKFWELVLSSVCWAWKHTQRFPALRRLRHQDGQELETNMGHRVRPNHNNSNKHYGETEGLKQFVSLLVHLALG